MPTATIKIYLQAQGAHFLGAHAYQPSNIIVSLNYSGGVLNLPYPINPSQTTDGRVTANFEPGNCSFMPIITVVESGNLQTVTTNFLAKQSTTACASSVFTLPDKIEQANIRASIPTPSGSPLLIQYPLLLNPNQTDYSVTIVVPGLYLTPAKITGQLAVYVKLMCGCPITMGPPASLWPASDFSVKAALTNILNQQTIYNLSYDTTQKGNSLFTAPLLSPLSGIKTITYFAKQKSISNWGIVEEVLK